MQYTDIQTESRRIVKANSVSFPVSDITTSSNRALERVTGLIRQAQGRWQWDDSNNPDYAIATTLLVADQQDYELDPTHYQIERVEVKDQDGNWSKLESIDQADLYNTSLTDFLKTAGSPQYYDKVGNSIFLYPKPNYGQTASLKVFYERGPDYFETTDTTKQPGFNPLFHSLIPLWNAYDYAFINTLPILGSISERISLMEDDLKAYYSLRDKDEHLRLSTRRINYR